MLSQSKNTRAKNDLERALSSAIRVVLTNMSPNLPTSLDFLFSSLYPVRTRAGLNWAET